MKILDSYGPLAVLLFTRIEKLSRDNPDMFDLCMLNVQSDGLKFIQRVLGFFNFNFKQSMKQVNCRQKVEKLIQTLPPIREMHKVLLKQNTSEKVLKSYFINLQEKLIYKVVIDILEAYYKEYDGPFFKTYRKKLIPFALTLYQQIETEELIRMNT